MKKLILILIVLIMIPLMVGCKADHTEDYLSQMTELEDIKVVVMWEGVSKVTYYVSHQLQLNPEEILYYAPKKLQHGEEIYLNKKEIFFIFSVKPSLITTKIFREVTAQELKLIFE